MSIKVMECITNSESLIQHHAPSIIVPYKQYVMLVQKPSMLSS